MQHSADQHYKRLSIVAEPTDLVRARQKAVESRLHHLILILLPQPPPHRRSGPRRTPWRSLLFTALLASDALIQGDGEALSLALSEFEPRVVGILTSVCCARRQLTFCDMGIVWQSQQDAFAQRFTAPRTSRGCRSAVQRALLT